MKSTNILAATAIGLSLVGMAATAQDAMVTDADGDGAYSYEELMAAYPDMTEETFLTIDANADGLVDDEELAMARDGGLLPADG
ncbi:EF-hand domain-containing protein [Oceaniglobus trochenteri]|uniref:EF-hand domain-containing protein n=1 Tax=Oceaniglobus trochenteri TaxID=2763260 RepID=UPI001CFFE976|nr:EF-hand domain-containing protein [Oceaniglobus trochenteri]